MKLKLLRKSGDLLILGVVNATLMLIIFFQKFVDKILQKQLLCISSELLLYIYF